jgi:hypothetical protein
MGFNSGFKGLRKIGLWALLAFTPWMLRGCGGVAAQKTDGGTVYKQILISAKLKTGKRGQETELTRRSPLRRCRSVMDCSAV